MNNSLMNLKIDITGSRAFIIGELNELLLILAGHQEEFIDNKAIWEGEGYREELTLIKEDDSE